MKRYITDNNIDKLILVSRTKKFEPCVLEKYGVETTDFVDFETITVDLGKASNLERLREYDVSVIIHSAGTLGGTNISKKALLWSNFHTTKNIVDYYSKTGSIEQLVFISSFGVLGPIPLSKIPADETFPYNPSNAYEESKMLAERYVLISDLPYTVIRPEFVYGPGDTHVLPLFKSAISGNFILINQGRSYLHPTYVDDLIMGVGLCIKNKKALGEIFNIVGQRYLTVKELAETIYFAFHKRKFAFRNVSKRSISLLARVADALNKIFKTNFPLSTDRVRFFTENRAADYTKAINILGYRPIPLNEGMSKTIMWHVKNGYL